MASDPTSPPKRGHAPTHRRAPEAGAERTGFRPDIEGLRALAVGSVLVYHAGLVWLPGGFAGVDVFFVISGFLITSLMMREVARTGRLALGAFWARRARRLLPAATLVLLFCAAVTVWILPPVDRRSFGGDIVAAAAYGVNWRLGYRSVDYLAEDVGASPVQHFWSLAVEEQFYVVWPLLIALVLLIFRRRVRLAFAILIGAGGLASFLFALHYSVTESGLSFFVSTTRAWELAVGALLAVAYPRLARLPAGARTVLGWLGLVVVVIGMLRIHSTDVWPGWETLVPVLGTASVILAGSTGLRYGPERLLGLRPVVWIGGLSYSLYLWHWAFLVTAQALWGQLRVREAALVVLVAAVPAWLSHRYVEDPLRRGRLLAGVRRALGFGATGMATAAAAGIAVVLSVNLVPTVALASAAQAPGAAALSDPDYAGVDWASVKHVSRMRPIPLEAGKDIPHRLYRTKCVVGDRSTDFEACDFGDRAGSRTVVLVGNSKAAQWFTPIDTIAKQAGWRLVTIVKNTCEFSTAPRLMDGHRDTTCPGWNDKALATIRKLHPDVVIAASRWGTALPPGGSSSADYTQQAAADGLAQRWQQVVDTGTKLVILEDNPSTGDRAECVQSHLDQLEKCAYPLGPAERSSGKPAEDEALAKVPAARAIDMTDVICPSHGVCPAVIGSVLVNRSGTHIGDTFAASATNQMAQRLARATGGLLGSATGD